MDHSNDQSNNIFEAHELCFAYNERITALDHISLFVKPGERLAIIGSNGSGKSTLLKLLDGLYFPSSGSVQAFGQNLIEQAFRDDLFNYEFRRRVGFVFQDSDVQLFMPSVWDEVAFAPLQLDIERSEVMKRVESALHSLNISNLKDRVPHQLSGGEKKRVALASVLSLSPEVWLLDEPTAGLDPRSVSWLLGFLNSQGEVGKTVVIATHDLSIVEATADRVYVLNEEHKIIAEGSPKEILADRSLLVNTNLTSVRQSEAGFWQNPKWF
ncbi:MAG: energy-coupling factor ABC transporter ATP-binding protein [Anaerolineaceae bacterium]|nr:energy-coupling factor ABC transporter ATP-binding protein [Anaerolineaceae bacterium]